MSEPCTAELLRRATQEVLETMFFTEVLGEAEPGETDAEPCLKVRVWFRGTLSGCLRLSVSGPAARAIAANFLGVEEEVLAASQVEDAICELANMICGSVLSRLAGESAFEIHQPEFEGPGSGSGDGESTARCFELEGGNLAVALSLAAGT